MAEPRPWRVAGFDTFAREEYGLGRYATREEAIAAAREAMARIERNQPRETAGELQDQVSVYGPDGAFVPFDRGGA
ncbi:hypothetical protein ACFQ1E_01450 [Sphingomonas canadensis]|uniref:DUF2188 domain-containing protein n=1 Tax=Sphingomonas canadensis TaxID=1219257 RepID=A0ABW3H1H9_9SPHN|nr:hypothetical protein [Sphingomonas canadensis]MCW3835092.1 hypothetical protein [Sphingomonas canadensis]